ncbi:MAG TPA: serine/threonine-protein kinase [Polyangiaceae bacterium]|nr:serine/threonine-protein kinase [Polyangiaceae bacterium]
MAAGVLAPGSEEGLPRRFGPYVLFDKIGEGGMARIFLARSGGGLGGERLLVVKEILPLLAASSDMSQLLVDEAKLCSDLTHKNVVQVTDLGREDGRLYIAMEYVEGLDLRELLRGCSQKKIPLPVEFSLFVILETLRALEYAHKKKGPDGRPLGIVHRDVSPSNVLLSVEGEVKLCDFGIARALTTGDALPEEAIQGKAGYMSPEAARGESVDARSDVFAVGILLWELLAGQRLYRSGAGRATIIAQAREGLIPDLPERGYADEPRLFAIVRRAVQREAAARYQSAQEMLDDLEAYVADNRLVASPLRFGDFLVEHFGAEIVARRRERERAARAEIAAPSPADEAAPTKPRSELPTLPDPNASALTAARPSDRPPPSSGRRISSRPPPAPPGPPASGANNWIIVVVVLLVAAAIALFVFGRR